MNLLMLGGLMRNIIIIMMILLLPLSSSCIPYLAGVIVTSRMNANARKDCVSQGGEYIDGSSWGWSGGRCVMPGENINVQNMTPPQKCVFLGGTYLDGQCNFPPEQECANYGGVYYASTGACDFRQTAPPNESETQNLAPPQKCAYLGGTYIDNKCTFPPQQECANNGGIYYESTGACDLRHKNK